MPLLVNYVTEYLRALIEWTKMIPQFETLKTDDRVYLVQSAWNEITIADIAHRSMEFEVFFKNHPKKLTSHLSRINC